ncbi:antibiotic biosynthesis monooxygenase family protein [Dyadobacter pollutisoli]|jgi:heme-degrading monooxygenase HmoA|uniref:Antibiotic biosynthesis monooxygenase n=1 Tax=Dyadobacter pollutisoli TaxID=2910158 RepID=A0A9E8NEI2_9BACT|nr:antibiotic biosynthesis monooxygenase [Dyadobacter pollutisoli]WAC15289.1 antibiotic biosynthesis monooxygenase [Dyadobacter pollutisoli]
MKVNSAHNVQFIDKFNVPQNGKQEFLERVKINRNLIKTLPGFIEDTAYERADQQGNLVYITIAVWESEEAIKNAKEIVQAEYKKQGFNMAEMFMRLNITMDRGVYKKLD